jgi:glycosyltransferase involved in cell wall biosynthesis
MQKAKVVFGMNSMFAVRHFLPDILAMTRDRGFEAIVVAPPGEDHGATNTIAGAEIRHVPMKREISPISDVFALWRMWSLLRAIRPAVTDVSTPKMGLIGGLAAWLAGVPHRIYTLRGLRYETTRGLKRALLMTCEWLACKSAHRVICISQSVKESAVRSGIVDGKKAVLLGERASEGISLRHRVHTEPASLQLPEAIPVIGFVGRLTRDKGIHELIEAFRILRRSGLEARLLLLGSFETGDPVDPATADAIRTDPDIHWLGYVPDPAPYYQRMDVCVLPTYREGLPTVLLEAAAAGKPVVSTRTTGVVDVVLDGITGLLVPPCDAAALACAISRLLTNRELASRMGRQARRLIAEQFDNSYYLNRLGAMLEASTRNSYSGRQDSQPPHPAKLKCS